MGSPHDTRKICPKCHRWMEKGLDVCHSCEVRSSPKEVKIGFIEVRISRPEPLYGWLKADEDSKQFTINIEVNGEEFHFQEVFPENHLISLFDRLMDHASRLIKDAVEKKLGNP